MKKPLLILHIGMPKSGSTSIQMSLLQNKDYLENNGIFFEGIYPKLYYLIYRVMKCPPAKSIKKLKPYLPPKAAIELFTNRFSGSGCKSAILSCEALYMRPSNKDNYKELCKTIKSLFSFFDIKIVCYFRRQDLFIESFYNQCFKDLHPLREPEIIVQPDIEWFNNNKNLTHFKSFVNMFPYDYYEVASILSDVFGKENVLARPFERNQLKNGLIYDFYSNILNCSDEVISKLKPVGNYNESICRDILEFQRLSKIDDSRIFTCVNKLSDNKNTNSAFFTDSERKDFLALYEESNASLAKEYLGREDGKFFYDEVKSYEVYSGLSLEKSKEIGRKLISIIHYNKRSNPEIDLNSHKSVAEVVKTVRSEYFDNLDKKYIEDKIEKLFSLLRDSKKNIVIYGAFGNLSDQIFKISEQYKRCVEVYVADKLLNNMAYYNDYAVVNLTVMEALSPDVILISAKFSGKAIKRDLEKLTLPNTLICPAYDFSDEIWEKIIPTFFTTPYQRS